MNYNIVTKEGESIANAQGELPRKDDSIVIDGTEYTVVKVKNTIKTNAMRRSSPYPYMTEKMEVIVSKEA